MSLLRRRCLLAQLIVLAGTSLAGAQTNPSRPRPVDLVVRVTYEGEQHPAGARLAVELMDGFGTSAEEKITNEEGIVQFRTVSGMHRLRVIGPEIVEYSGNLEIETVEVRRFENVRVRRKPGAVSMSPPGEGTIPAARLKIPDNARKEFQKGHQALEHRDWQEAKKRFEAAIARYPDYDLAYNGLGVALMNVGDSQGARPAFEKAIHLNEDFAEAYRNLAKIALADHNYEEVDTLLSRSLSSDPLNAWALTHAAYAELQLHKFDEAITHARKAHTVPHATLASVHIVCGLALEAEQQSAKAIEEYRAYLSEDPSGRDAARAREAIARLSGTAPK